MKPISYPTFHRPQRSKAPRRQGTFAWKWVWLLRGIFQRQLESLDQWLETFNQTRDLGSSTSSFFHDHEKEVFFFRQVVWFREILHLIISLPFFCVFVWVSIQYQNSKHGRTRKSSNTASATSSRNMVGPSTSIDKTLRSRLRFCRKVALVHRRSTARPKGWPCSIHLYIYTHIIKAIIYKYLTFIIIHYYKPHGFSKLQVFGWMNLMIFHLKAILRGTNHMTSS